METSNKVFVVTGGGNGIGRQLVLELLRRGAKVTAVDIRQDSLDETVRLADAGERLHTEIVDITNREATEALPAKVLSAHGAVDGLINNAGIIQPFVRLNDLEYRDIERVIAVNLWGTIHMVKAFLPHLLERPVAHIANTSSMGGFLPVPGQTIYGAAKAAVKLMTEGLYSELLDTAVEVSVIMPGAVGTEITTNSGVDIPGGVDAESTTIKTTSPEEAAQIILDGIEADDLYIHVGRDSKTMSPFTRIAPQRATRMIQKRMKALLG
ncbi:MAG TPA: SDR family oxidoreductase [Acidimicrobiia bacterium]